LIAGTLNCINNEESDNKSKIGPVTKAAAVYATGTAVFGSIGKVLHKFSGASKYEICYDAIEKSALNVIDYPKKFYSSSMARYYASKSANVLLHTASIFSLPYRSVYLSTFFPINYINYAVKTKHKMKDPNLSNEQISNRKLHLNQQKQLFRSQMRRAPLGALVGFGLPYLTKFQYKPFNIYGTQKQQA